MLVISLCTISSICFAGKLAYEPETPTSASFSATDQYANQFITFVNYAKADGHSEYWVRFTILSDNNKLLYNASLNIDGIVYELQPVYEPTYKYEYAAYSNIDNNIHRNISGSQPFRYYLIPSDIVEKIKTARKVIFIYNRINKLDVPITLYDNYLQNIKSIFDLKYADLSTYFHPSSAD